MKLVKTLGFTNEFHDIYDPIIYGKKSIMDIIFVVENKWKDLLKKIKNYPYDNMIGSHTNKIAL